MLFQGLALAPKTSATAISLITLTLFLAFLTSLFRSIDPQAANILRDISLWTLTVACIPIALLPFSLFYHIILWFDDTNKPISII